MYVVETSFTLKQSTKGVQGRVTLLGPFPQRSLGTSRVRRLPVLFGETDECPVLDLGLPPTGPPPLVLWWTGVEVVCDDGHVRFTT